MVSTRRGTRCSHVEIQGCFFVAFFELFAAHPSGALAGGETDVVALIARPEHNLQARTAGRRQFRRRKKNKENERARAREEGRREDISRCRMTVSSKH